jgi:hypothetical protein
MNVHLFSCDDGWHLTLWHLNVYWIKPCRWHWNPCRWHWKPWKSGRCIYWLRLAIEWA